MEVESCPRCSSKMGAALKSGRQVCANCGWTMDPTRSGSTPVPPPSSRRSQSGILRLFASLLRILVRAISFWLLSIKHFLGRLFQSGKQNRPQPGQLLQSWNQRLSNLEEAIPTAATLHAPKWMTKEAAFKFLGGDPKDPWSEVTNRSGNRRMKSSNFLELNSVEEFRDFGLEYNLERRDGNRPCLRWISSD
jgi:hypothetical protein